jgi:hypothetical protein
MWFGLGTRIGAQSSLSNISDMSDRPEETGVRKSWEGAEKGKWCAVDDGEGDQKSASMSYSFPNSGAYHY